MLSLQSCPRKMVHKKDFCYLHLPWDSCLLLALLKSNTLVVTENKGERKKKNHFNGPQFSNAYCTQKPVKQLRKQDCHTPRCFYRSCCLMSFTKKGNGNLEACQAWFQFSKNTYSFIQSFIGHIFKSKLAACLEFSGDSGD